MITIAKEIVILLNAILMIVIMTRTSPFNLKPECVDEMTVDAETEIKHKAACVWKLVSLTFSQMQLKQYCTLYGITINDALKWKSYWE